MGLPVSRSYSRVEELGALAQELWQLRQALIRSVTDEAEAPAVLRSLRVLVLDDGALLLRLAKHFRVDREIATIPPARPAKANGDTPESGALVLPGMILVASTDPYAKWREVRGDTKERPAGEPLRVTFDGYLELGIAADSHRAAPVSRRELLRDVLQQSFIVHASKDRPDHVEMARVVLEGGRHYVELAQELAFETLLFGNKILAAASTRMGVVVSSLQTPDGVCVRIATCAGCSAQLECAEFTCRACGQRVLPPAAAEPPSADNVSRSVKLALGLEIATLWFVLTIPSLFDPGAGWFAIIEARDAAGRSAILYRTGDMHLVWTVFRDGRQQVARLPLAARRVNGGPESKRVLMLGWSKDRCMVEIMSRAGDLWASSDGAKLWPAPEASPHADS